MHFMDLLDFVDLTSAFLWTLIGFGFMISIHLVPLAVSEHFVCPRDGNCREVTVLDLDFQYRLAYVKWTRTI